MSDKIPNLQITLAVEPRLQFQPLMLALEELAEFLSVETKFDLKNVLYSALVWAGMHPAGTPRLPDNVAPLQGVNPSRYAIAMHKEAEATFVESRKAAKRLKDALITALGPDISKEIKHATRGHMDQEVHEIISLVRATYGTLNS